MGLLVIAWSQDKTVGITLRSQDQSLIEVLNYLSEQYDIKFSYDAALLEEIKVDLNVHGVGIEELLNQVLEKNDLNFRFIAGTYAIFKDKLKGAKKNEAKSFKGVLLDYSSGEALPYANVLFNDSLGTFTNQLGIFSFKFDPSNAVKLKISYIGYEGLDTCINIKDDKNITTFYLKETSEIIQQVSVQGSDLEIIKEGTQSGEMVFNPHLSSFLPHLGEPDFLQAISILPGISSLGTANGFSIRGSLPYSNLILLDGFPVFNINHYLGNISTINPKYIKSIKLSRGGFGANYGGSIAGIVDIIGKTGNRNKPAFDFSVNLLSANVLAEVPLTSKSTILFAGRRSYNDVVRTYLFEKLFNLSTTQKNGSEENGLESDLLPTYNFQDYHAKFTYQPSIKEKVSATIYMSSDKLDYTLNENEADYRFLYQNLENWTNKGIGLDWGKQYSELFFSNVNIGISNFDNERIIESNYEDQFDGNQFSSKTLTKEYNRVESLQLNWHNRLSVADQNSFEFGINLRNNSIVASYDEIITGNNDYDYSIKEKATTYTLYSKYKLNLFKSLVFSPGIRMTYLSQNGEVYWEPRLALVYKLSPKLNLHSELGRYYQFLSNMTQYDELGNYVNYWVLGYDGINPAESFHFQGGINYTNNGFLIKIDPYLRRSKGIAVNYFVPFNNDSNDNSEVTSYSGSQKSSGIDLFIKKGFRRYITTASFSYGRTYNSFSGINGGNYFPSNNDSPFQMKLSGIYRIKKWSFSYLWSYASGTPYTDLRDNQQLYNKSRLPDQHQLDLAAVYNFKLKKVKGNFGFSINNFYNKKNILHKRFLNANTYDEFDELQITNIVSNGFLPVIFVDFSF